MVLHRNLSEILGVNASKLEIGYIDTDDTLNGCKIHIIHKVASMEGDITKLYDGKYEILSESIKKIYHISLEWGVFCTLSGDDMDRNEMIKIHEKINIPKNISPSTP